MVKVCCIPKCGSHSKADSSPKISFHKFPIGAHSNDLWTRKVLRESTWKPSKHSVVCSKHFDEDDFIIEKSKRLKNNKKQLDQELLIKDTFNTVDEGCHKFQNEVLPEGFTFLNKNDTLAFLHYNEDLDVPEVLLSLVIKSDLTFSIGYKGNKLDNKIVRHLATGGKISKVSTTLNILSYLKSREEAPPPDHSVLNSVLNKLEAISSEMEYEKLQSQISFSIEQVRLAVISPHTRRYSPFLLLQCRPIGREYLRHYIRN
ncbi:unnamed protein product [Lepeophtheirus salmonis]|uniref:(salmon louse) hypothetical protein n=1 Tax=Lepeophtheirus salmonis TaxID=72036 RepID=A0A7R8D0R5_LEPSM|nr:unnamed protein product [Lepeophtheirus salmonis]CAF2986872.1 unnamed protein product [Lepeophtheirus salmonis]